MEELQCKVCATHEVYEGMVTLGVDPTEAFHNAVVLLLEDVVEIAVDEGFNLGHNVGYKEATEDLAEIVGSYLRTIQETE